MYSNNLAVIIARSKSFTTPSMPTGRTVIHHYDNGRPKRRIRSAIPSSRTSMDVDDLLTISTTNVKHLNMSYKVTSRHKGLHKLEHKGLHKQEHKGLHNKGLHNKEQDDIHTDDNTQSEAMLNIKIKVVVGHQSQQQQSTELPSLLQDDKHNSKISKQSFMKKPCTSKLSPLTGAYSKLPIGTLSGNSLCLTCKNSGIK